MIVCALFILEMLFFYTYLTKVFFCFDFSYRAD